MFNGGRFFGGDKTYLKARVSRFVIDGRGKKEAL